MRGTRALECAVTRNLSDKRRKPYPSVRKPRKTVFTPAIWAHWLTPPPKETTLRLRAGIAEFRQRLLAGEHSVSHIPTNHTQEMQHDYQKT